MEGSHEMKNEGQSMPRHCTLCHVTSGPRNKMSDNHFFLDTHMHTRARSYLGHVTLAHLGQVAHAHSGQVMDAHTGQVTHAHLGQVIHAHLGQVTHSHLGQVTHAYLGQVTHAHWDR